MRLSKEESGAVAMGMMGLWLRVSKVVPRQRKEPAEQGDTAGT